MSPEMLNLYINADNVYGEYIPEKSDIFSLGLTFLRYINIWTKDKLVD